MCSFPPEDRALPRITRLAAFQSGQHVLRFSGRGAVDRDDEACRWRDRLDAGICRRSSGNVQECSGWLVGSDAFVRKRFTLLNASSRAVRAQLAAVEILTKMSGVEISDASATIPLLGHDVDVAEILRRQDYVTVIQASLARFAAGIRAIQHLSEGK